MSAYQEQRRAEDAAAAAGEWGRLGARLRDRGLSQEQTDSILAHGERAVIEATARLGRGEPGQVEYRQREDSDPVAGSGAGVADSTESAARSAAAPVLSIGLRSAEQVGYDLAWEARQGRAEDWRRDSSLPSRVVSMLTVGEDRTAERRPVTAAGRPAVEDWSAGSCQEAGLSLLADPAVAAADGDVRWASYEDGRGLDDGMVDE